MVETNPGTGVPAGDVDAILAPIEALLAPSYDSASEETWQINGHVLPIDPDDLRDALAAARAAAQERLANAVRDVTAQIVREHRRRTDDSHPEGWCGCSCGETVWDHDDHVAECIAAAMYSGHRARGPVVGGQPDDDGGTDPRCFRAADRAPSLAEAELSRLRDRAHLEYRICYVPKDTDGYDRPLSTSKSPEEAAGDLWLMNNHIASCSVS